MVKGGIIPFYLIKNLTFLSSMVIETVNNKSKLQTIIPNPFNQGLNEG